MSAHRPLTHIRVVDLSQGLAGPSCGLYLAEYGARVVKVEPPDGDWGRSMGSDIAGMSPMAQSYNRGKRGLAIDLKTAPGKDAVLRLARVSDVFIQSARPGAMQRLGLDFEAIRKVRPDIVYVSVSGYGQTGPARALPMTDTDGPHWRGWRHQRCRGAYPADTGPARLRCPIAATGRAFPRDPGRDRVWRGRDRRHDRQRHRRSSSMKGSCP